MNLILKCATISLIITTAMFAGAILQYWIFKQHKTKQFAKKGLKEEEQ